LAVAAVWVGCVGLTLPAAAQDAAPAAPIDPEAAERAAQQMEEMFEDLPMDINAAGLTSGEGMFGAMFGPSVTKADFKSYIGLLGLDKEQAEAAETVYRQRLENYEVKGKPMQELLVEALKKMGEMMTRGEHQQEPDNLEQLSKAAVEIQSERESMARGVMEDLKALATTAQLERWPKVEMAERRNTLMRFQPLMMAPGALVEMRALVETTLAKKGIEQPVEMGKQQIEQTLEAHDLAIDEQARLAVPIDARMRTSMGMGSKATPEQQQEMMKAMGEGWQIAERVRKAHEAAIKSIAAVLSDSTRAVFMDEYHARAYPAIYRTTHAERVLEAAAGFADLSDEQRGQIKTMREEHLAKLKEMRPKAAEQIVEQNRVQAELMAAKDDEARMKLMERMNAAYKDNLRELMRTADKDVIKRARAVLTESQREKLPKRPRPNLPFEIQPAGEEGAR
jgi:hypothetical protein